MRVFWQLLNVWKGNKFELHPRFTLFPQYVYLRFIRVERNQAWVNFTSTFLSRFPINFDEIQSDGGPWANLWPYQFLWGFGETAEEIGFCDVTMRFGSASCRRLGFVIIQNVYCQSPHTTYFVPLRTASLQPFSCSHMHKLHLLLYKQRDSPPLPEFY